MRRTFARGLVARARAFASTTTTSTATAPFATTPSARAAMRDGSASVSRTTAASATPFARRAFSDARKREDALNDLFVEAREEIENAMESVGSTYFNEDAEHARDAVATAVEAYEALLASLPDDDARGAMRRGMGMKFEQLRGELAALDSAHDDH
jgi:hypothetical protein